MSLFESKILEIALPVPLRRTFDYLAIDEHGAHLDTLVPGQRVLTPFGRQTLVGIVVSVKTESEFPQEKLKAVKALLDPESCFQEVDLRLLNWAAQYYQQSLGDVYHAALPKLLREGNTIESQLAKRFYPTPALPESLPAKAKAQIKLLHLFQQDLTQGHDKAELKEAGISTATINKFIEQTWACWETDRSPVKTVIDDDIVEPLQLNTEQAIAVSAINSHSGFQCYLLDGITGSGKTEVYLQTIANVLLKQQQVMVLVPEIGLTPQTIERFRSRFKVDVALWHSNMTDKQRFATWQANAQWTSKNRHCHSLWCLFAFPAIGHDSH